MMTSWTMSIQAQKACADFILARNITIDALFTDRWALDQAVEAYRAFDRKAAAKACFNLTDPTPARRAHYPLFSQTSMNAKPSIHTLSSATESYLARNQHKLLIGGQWVEAISGQTIETRNPSTGAVLGRLAAGDAADMDLAVRAAREAFEGPWEVLDAVRTADAAIPRARCDGGPFR